MQDRAQFTEHQEVQNEVRDLTTSEMRREIVRVKQQLEEYAHRLADLFYELAGIRDALREAQAVAECLLMRDPFDAWQERKRLEEEEIHAFLRSRMEDDEPEIED
jgi:hypothetical protein